MAPTRVCGCDRVGSGCAWVWVRQQQGEAIYRRRKPQNPLPDLEPSKQACSTRYVGGRASVASDAAVGALVGALVFFKSKTKQDPRLRSRYFWNWVCRSRCEGGERQGRGLTMMMMMMSSSSCGCEGVVTVQRERKRQRERRLQREKTKKKEEVAGRAEKRERATGQFEKKREGMRVFGKRKGRELGAATWQFRRERKFR